MQKNKINLIDLPYTELERELKNLNVPRFRAQQLCNWFYKNLVFSLEQMPNIPKSIKTTLEENFSIYLPEIHHVAKSKIDNSYKFLLKTNDNKLIESILMPEAKRTTLCVSCMVGCPLACKFCATGSQIGFIRKLTTAEIIGQVLVILNYAQTHDFTQKITNIVFMGMGEPFLNQKAVEKSIDILIHPECFALSPSKIAVSTAGVSPGIAKFIEKTNVRLAVSLHFPTNELRSEYMPVNKRFPLEQLIAELQKVKLKKRNHILIEYMLLAGINDSLIHAKQLCKLLSKLKIKINLIPYNPTKTLPAQASNEETIDNFAKYIKSKGLFVSVRRSKGADIEGGCGQFSLKKQ